MNCEMALSKCSSIVKGIQVVRRLAYSVQASAVASKKPDWNRAVSDAEKIVGYPTSYLSLRCLLSDEISNIAFHVRKLVGTSHPLLKTAKRLVYNGRNNMQTRGLIVLLISKAAGHPNGDLCPDQEKPLGVSNSQRSLAEVTEMIHTAQMIHKGVVNLSGQASFPDGSTMKDMEFGNKMAILSGDYLLSSASLGLAALRNCKVVELVSGAIGDFQEVEFIGESDYLGNFIPSEDMSIADWTERSYLYAGSLMAKSCKASLVLAGHTEQVQQWAFDFGKHLALAWQVYSELQPFTDLYRHPPGTAFDLMSAPVVLHLQNDPDTRSYIQATISAEKSADHLDFRKIHGRMMESGAVESAKDLCQDLTNRALKELLRFEENDARTALENIVHALRKF